MALQPLGTSDLVVSKACLGAMMWGDQVDASVATEMLDVAFDEFGVNFIVSPLPSLANVQGNLTFFFSLSL